MKEAQQQAATFVRQHDAQLPAAGIAHIGDFDPRTHQRVLAVDQAGDRRQPAAVLITLRQVKQQIADGFQAEVAQRTGDLRSGRGPVGQPRP
jgi:hypothetical protein